MRLINKKVRDLRNKKCFLFDLDNTIMLNNKPMKFARQLLETLNKNKKDIYLITNNNDCLHIGRW